jgi:hypothetical protein
MSSLHWVSSIWRCSWAAKPTQGRQGPHSCHETFHKLDITEMNVSGPEMPTLHISVSPLQFAAIINTAKTLHFPKVRRGRNA